MESQQYPGNAVIMYATNVLTLLGSRCVMFFFCRVQIKCMCMYKRLLRDKTVIRMFWMIGDKNTVQPAAQPLRHISNQA